VHTFWTFNYIFTGDDGVDNVMRPDELFMTKESAIKGCKRHFQELMVDDKGFYDIEFYWYPDLDHKGAFYSHIEPRDHRSMTFSVWPMGLHAGEVQ